LRFSSRSARALRTNQNTVAAAPKIMREEESSMGHRQPALSVITARPQEKPT
jgi:hypothetical protein